MNNKVFIIAEISANHQNSLKKTKKLIDKIKESGADSIKFQTFKPEHITINIKSKNFKIKENKSLWKGKYLFDLYKESALPFEWHRELFSYVKKKNMIPFSSVFDEDGLKFLQSIKCPIYKIASLENNHFPLLKKLAKTKKPIIISSGATDFNDLRKSVNYLKKNGCKDLSILKCTSQYPAKNHNLNLLALKKIAKLKCKIGFSDHSIGSTAAIMAVSLGAIILEKHVKLASNSSLDDKFSMKVEDFKDFVKDIRIAEKSLGKERIFLTKDEKNANKRKRSIIVINKIKKDEIISKHNIKVLRPNIGDNPINYEKSIGRKAKKPFNIGDPFFFRFTKK